MTGSPPPPADGPREATEDQGAQPWERQYVRSLARHSPAVAKLVAERDALSSLLRGMARRAVVQSRGERVLHRHLLAAEQQIHAVRALADGMFAEVQQLRARDASGRWEAAVINATANRILVALDGPAGSETPAETGGTPETDDAPAGAHDAMRAYGVDPHTYVPSVTSSTNTAPIRAADFIITPAHDGDTCAEIDEALDNAHGDLNKIITWLGKRGVEKAGPTARDVISGIQSLIKKAAGSVTTTPDQSALGAAARALQHRWAFLADRSDTMSRGDADELVRTVLAALAGTAPTPGPDLAEPQWETDETRTEWAVRSTGTGGLVEVGMIAAEKYVRRWAESFPVDHPAEIASAEAVFRVVQHRETAWTPAPTDPALIGTWADPDSRAHQDHKHPVEGCGFCPSEEDR